MLLKIVKQLNFVLGAEPGEQDSVSVHDSMLPLVVRYLDDYGPEWVTRHSVTEHFFRMKI